jgi:hypothetical protein
LQQWACQFEETAELSRFYKERGIALLALRKISRQ